MAEQREDLSLDYSYPQDTQGAISQQIGFCGLVETCFSASFRLWVDVTILRVSSN